MMMFDDKVGGWEWLNDDVIKKEIRKKREPGSDTMHTGQNGLSI